MRKMKTIVVFIAASLLLSLSSLQAAEEIRISVPASMTDAMKDLSRPVRGFGQACAGRTELWPIGNPGQTDCRRCAR